MIKQDHTLTNSSEEDTLLTRKQVSERWNCHTETVKRRTRSGELPAVYLSARSIRHRLSDVREFEAKGTY